MRQHMWGLYAELEQERAEKAAAQQAALLGPAAPPSAAAVAAASSALDKGEDGEARSPVERQLLARLQEEQRHLQELERCLQVAHTNEQRK